MVVLNTRAPRRRENGCACRQQRTKRLNIRDQKVGHAGALLQRHSPVLDHMREQKMPAFAALPRLLGKVLECALSKNGAGQGAVARAGHLETRAAFRWRCENGNVCMIRVIIYCNGVA